MKFLFILLFLSGHLLVASNGDWSKTGHRAVGQVAEKHLTRKARKAIESLLNGRSLATVSNFADEIKSDTAYREFGPWHYVNMPADKRYREVEPSPHGDVVSGIQKCVQVLESETGTLGDKRFYLKMLVHLIGDLHQPLHGGRAEDKGGNDIQLQWFGEGTNLHRVWDSHMVDDYKMSYTELVNSFPKLGKKEVMALQEGDIFSWVDETQDLANEVYGSVEMGEKLYYRYSYDWWSTVEVQIQKGGIRLAKVLNGIFD